MLVVLFPNLDLGRCVIGSVLSGEGVGATQRAESERVLLEEGTRAGSVRGVGELVEAAMGEDGEDEEEQRLVRNVRCALGTYRRST